MLPNFVDTPDGLKSEICHLNGNIIDMSICEYIKNLSNKFNWGNRFCRRLNRIYLAIIH